MANAFGTLSKGLKVCANKKNADQIEKILALVETFKNPEVLAVHLGHDILFNGVDIEKRIVQAVGFYENKKWLSFGQELGSMLSEIAIGTEVMLGSKQATVDKQKIEQISLGLFEGALNEENLQDIV